MSLAAELAAKAWNCSLLAWAAAAWRCSIARCCGFVLSCGTQSRADWHKSFKNGAQRHLKAPKWIQIGAKWVPKSPKKMWIRGLMGKYIAAILDTWEFEHWRACRLVFYPIPARNPQAESTQTQYKRERRARAFENWRAFRTVFQWVLDWDLLAEYGK